jgi:hypothetical protein
MFLMRYGQNSGKKMNNINSMPDSGFQLEFAHV